MKNPDSPKSRSPRRMGTHGHWKHDGEPLNRHPEMKAVF